MRVLSLFAGIGGADIALEALGCTTEAFSDIEPYACDVFRKRFPDAAPLGSVTDISLAEGAFDIIVGGFPCQDISNAGKRAGIDGERSGLWGEYARLIGEVKPRLVLIENVSALLRRGIDRVLWDLHELGYACEWDCVPAAAVGAPHLRDRIWMVAYPDDLSVQTVFKGRRPEVLAALKDPIAKFPRAGKLEQGVVFSCDPMAKRQTKRIDGRTYWNGVNLGDTAAPPQWPTPTARDWKDTGDLLKVPVNGSRQQAVHRAELGLWPTPAASVPNLGEGVDTWEARRLRTKERVGNGNGFGTPLTIAVQQPMWPTPRASWNENRGTRRSPAAANGSHGKKLAEEANEAEVEQGRVRGYLNPDWVEWLMGFPVGWTDLSCDAPTAFGWDVEPAIPRVAEGVVKRKQRLTCCGNALVPAVMYWVAAQALTAVFNKEVSTA